MYWSTLSDLDIDDLFAVEDVGQEALEITASASQGAFGVEAPHYRNEADEVLQTCSDGASSAAPHASSRTITSAAFPHSLETVFQSNPSSFSLHVGSPKLDAFSKCIPKKGFRSGGGDPDDIRSLLCTLPVPDCQTFTCSAVSRGMGFFSAKNEFYDFKYHRMKVIQELGHESLRIARSQRCCLYCVFFKYTNGNGDSLAHFNLSSCPNTDLFRDGKSYLDVYRPSLKWRSDDYCYWCCLPHGANGNHVRNPGPGERCDCLLLDYVKPLSYLAVMTPSLHCLFSKVGGLDPLQIDLNQMSHSRLGDIARWMGRGTNQESWMNCLELVYVMAVHFRFADL